MQFSEGHFLSDYVKDPLYRFGLDLIQLNLGLLGFVGDSLGIRWGLVWGFSRLLWAQLGFAVGSFWDVDLLRSSHGNNLILTKPLLQCQSNAGALAHK